MGNKREVPSFLKKILNWDIKITNDIYSKFVKHFGPTNRHATTLKTLELSAHGILWIVLCLAIAFLSNNFTVQHLAINLLIAQILDLIVVSVIKALVRRRRPMPITNELLTIQAVDKFSFPSGHATKTALIVSLLSMQYDLWLIFESVLYCWFLAVCVSRVLLKRHHLLDVVAGIILGWIESLFIVFTGLWLSPGNANYLLNYLLDDNREGAYQV